MVRIKVTWSLPLLSWLPCVECGNGLSLQVSRCWGAYQIGRSGNVLEHGLSIPESLDCFVELRGIVHHHSVSFCGFVSVEHALSRVGAGLFSGQRFCCSIVLHTWIPREMHNPRTYSRHLSQAMLLKWLIKTVTWYGHCAEQIIIASGWLSEVSSVTRSGGH